MVEDTEPKFIFDLNANAVVSVTYGFLKKWFDEELVPVKECRLGLVMHSHMRGVGKTVFAKSLLATKEHIVYNRGALDASAFISSPRARLVILDDIKMKPDDIETFKALVVGEETQVVTKYYNYKYTGGAEYIFITNNSARFLKMMRSQNFRQYCMFFELNQYIGPVGSDPKYNDRPVICNIPYDQLTKKLQEQIEGFNKRYDSPLTNCISIPVKKVEKPSLFHV